MLTGRGMVNALPLLACTLGALLLAGCPGDGQSGQGASAPATTGVSTAEGTEQGGAQDAAGGPQRGSTASGAGGESSDAAESEESAAAPEGGADEGSAEKPVDESVQPLPEKIPDSRFSKWEKDTRPRPKQEAKGEKYRIDCEFLSAKFNNAEDAELSKLEWYAKADLPDSEFVEARMEADSPDDEPRGRLDLGWCYVEVVPMIPQAERTAVRGKEMADYTYYGEYVLQLFDNRDRLMAMVKMTRENMLEVNYGEPGSVSKLYSVVGKYDAASQDVEGYNIFVKDGPDGSRTLLCRLEYRSGGFNTHETRDVMTNRFIYRYPAGRLEIELFKEP